jgi:hypothetical protein
MRLKMRTENLRSLISLTRNVLLEFGILIRSNNIEI